MEACSWSNIPDEDFALADDNHWTIGQFVWTGFDYLGEPSPYDTDAWPNHSSMFGIIDLASIPKDRYYLYRSVWNKDAETLHILPHWTWPGREGEVTPVFVYTNYPTAELFINGKSYGKQSKNNSSLKSRYRLMWMDAVYEPGEVKVVAYNKEGKDSTRKIISNWFNRNCRKTSSYRTGTAIVQAGEIAGDLVLTAKASGVKTGTVHLQAK